jgi:hypothetical protein
MAPEGFFERRRLFRQPGGPGLQTVLPPPVQEPSMSDAIPFNLPRWEWRTFAPSLGGLRERLHGTAGPDFQETREIRLLCHGSMHDVLIHPAGIQLKWRKQVGPGGLELWDSVLHSAFPCPSRILIGLFGDLGLPAPHLDRSFYTQTQLLQEVLEQHPDLRVVDIEKRSQTFLLDGASCELTELHADQVTVEAFSIEHEDPGLALQVLRHLGFQARTNISYPQGLKAALHFSKQH